MTPTYFLIALIVFSAVVTELFVERRLLTYLQYFQQNEYERKRFIAWLWQHRLFDRHASLLILLVGLATLYKTWLVWPMLSIGFIAILWLSKDPRRDGKLPLNMTARAKRIYGVALLLALLTGVALIYLLMTAHPAYKVLCAMVYIQTLPLWLVFSTTLLNPHERGAQQTFIDEAKVILNKVNPTVIGITGSYGKTSTKTILATFMHSVGPTFWSPGSINTVMGITRKIREELKPGTQFAIIEMAAYGVGSIQRLCQLTPPHVGLITNVGIMHLERYGSRETIYRAKSELAQALPSDGTLIVNADNDYAHKMASEYPSGRTLTYGIDATNADVRMSDIRIGDQGVTHFKIHWNGEIFNGQTQLLGRPMLSNLLGAFTTAAALGGNPNTLIALCSQLKTAPHRLELRQQADHLILDDAYNSNPNGFTAALEVLRDMPKGRKIVMSPGMIELGNEQHKQNKDVARFAADIVDAFYVVGTTNREALVSGLKEGGLVDTAIHVVDHRDEAHAHFAQHKQPNDVVLWENDFSDIYENLPKL